MGMGISLSKGVIAMRTLLLIACAITAIGGATTDNAGACTLNPTFEVTGFPITAHQVAVLGSAHVEERAATPTLGLADMPASPHQIAVLTPRAKTVKMADAAGDSVGPTDLSSKTRSTTAAAGLCVPD